MKQVKDEAVNAFGQDEQHLSRAAVEQMDYTVSALKVRSASEFGICTDRLQSGLSSSSQHCEIPTPGGCTSLGIHPQESLRKYSVVPVVVRHLSADDELEGHPVPAGTTVICHLQVRSYHISSAATVSHLCQADAGRPASRCSSCAQSNQSCLGFVGCAPHMEVTRVVASSALHARGRIRFL